MTTGGVTVSKEGEPRSDGDRPSCGAAPLGPSGWVPEGGGRVRVAGRLIAVVVLVSALVALAAPSLAQASAAGQMYAFGDNQDGQLGSVANNGTTNANPVPVLVGLPGQTGPVVQVAAGYTHSLAVTSTGQLYAFGGNNYGQLGTVTNSGTNTATPTPVLVGLPGQTGPVVQVAAGYTHSLAVTSTGQLYAFGENDYGELGNTTNSGTANPNPTPVLVGLPGADRPGGAGRRRRKPQSGGDLDRAAIRVWLQPIRATGQHDEQWHCQPEPDAGAGGVAGAGRPGGAGRRRV